MTATGLFSNYSHVDLKCVSQSVPHFSAYTLHRARTVVGRRLERYSICRLLSKVKPFVNNG